MTRHDLRERVFWFCFRAPFHDAEELKDQFELYIEQEELFDATPDDIEYIRERCLRIQEHLEEIDALLNDNTTGWDTTRFGKAELAVMRVAVYEMCFDDDVPEGVAIDEAVELAKKYGQKASGGFVNAILTKVQHAWRDAKNAEE